MRYVVGYVDAIQEYGGWAVNDLHPIGVVDMDSTALDDDETILEILNECGYTEDLSVFNTEIDGDGDCLTLLDAESGRPMYQLVFEGA